MLDKERYSPINDVLVELGRVFKNFYTVNATDVVKKKGLPKAVNIIASAVFTSMIWKSVVEGLCVEGIKILIRRRIEYNTKIPVSK